MVQEKIILLIMVAFPFGVLTKMILGWHALDIMLVLLLMVGFSFPKWARGLAIVSGFSLLASGNLSGGLYWLRLISVLNLAGVVRNLVKEKCLKREMIIESLLIVGMIILALGIAQYLIWPDLRGLKGLGWDDHYYRLVGTFLDPGFTGILMVLALLLAFIKKRYVWAIVLLIGLALTYSRASYLALGAGMGYLFLVGKQRAWAVMFVVLLLVMIPILPRPGGEGVKLTRTASIAQRGENYSEAWQIIKTSPLLGVGFNNVCAAKEAMGVSAGVNSCGGLDNSFLFVWATMGILGLLIYLGMGFRVWQGSGVLVRVSIIAVLIHSMFHNTLFYLWVMVWMAILIGREKVGTRPTKLRLTFSRLF